MTEPKLKPCPFCGGEAETEEIAPYCVWVVQCGSCGAGIGDFDTEEDAIEAWNKRVGSEVAE